jgi:hypothetical protein
MPYALVSGGILGAAFDQIVNEDYQGTYHWTDKYKAFASINGETDIFNVDFDNYAKQSVVQKYNAFQDSPFKIGMNYSEQMAGFFDWVVLLTMSMTQARLLKRVFHQLICYEIDRF